MAGEEGVSVRVGRGGVEGVGADDDAGRAGLLAPSAGVLLTDAGDENGNAPTLAAGVAVALLSSDMEEDNAIGSVIAVRASNNPAAPCGAGGVSPSSPEPCEP